MKIAVTSQKPDINSEMDERFGRAPYILIVDSDTFEFETLDNRENMNSLKGAGIQSAIAVSEKGAEALVTGFCGPNAVKTLKAAKIKIAVDFKGLVKEAVSAFNRGELSFTEEPNAEGQWM